MLMKINKLKEEKRVNLNYIYPSFSFSKYCCLFHCLDRKGGENDKQENQKDSNGIKICNSE